MHARDSVRLCSLVTVVGFLNAPNLAGLLEGQTIPDHIQHIQNGNACIVIHITQHSPGEIRGWIF